MDDVPSNGWLSPKGTMFAVSFNDHIKITCRFYGHTSNPEYAMEQAGWWKLSNFTDRGRPRWMGCRRATRQQRSYIRRWCHRWNGELDNHGWASLISRKYVEVPELNDGLPSTTYRR
jgi:hypothetical protein